MTREKVLLDTDIGSDIDDALALAYLLRHPGEITLLAIGPLTNVGALFAMGSEVASLLKRLVLMAGCFASANRSENNVRNDVVAATIVYGGGGQSRPPHHVSFGLDVTTRVTMDAATARDALAGDAFAPVRDFLEVWLRKADRVTFHDPLAAAPIFALDLVTYRRGTVAVSTTWPA